MVLKGTVFSQFKPKFFLPFITFLLEVFPALQVAVAVLIDVFL